MVQLPGSRKRRAEPAAAGPVPVKEEVEQGLVDRNGPPLKRVEAVPPSLLPPPPPLVKPFDVLDEPSPLGLRLKKSSSFLDMIQKKLFQEKSGAGLCVVDNSNFEMPMKEEVKSARARERLKASNFPANVLKIGTWEYISRYEGDLVAKCYFAKHKLVWEVLDDGLKSKIEIQWSDITALKVICPENEQGTLDLVLARPPLFFKETDPQPRKHTLWHVASDFTDGQASLNRRHTLYCPSTLLSKNLEKLIQCDERLYELSQQQDIILETSYFEPRQSSFENSNEMKDCKGFNNLKHEREMALAKFTNLVSSCAFSSPSNEVGHLEFLVQPINIDFQASCVPKKPKDPKRRNQLKKHGLRESMSVDDLVDYLDNFMVEQRTAVNPNLSHNKEQSKEDLEDLVQYLFSDTQVLPVSDDKYLARVTSFYSLLQDDSVPSTMTKPEGKDSSNICVVDLDSDSSDDELKSSRVGKSTRVTKPSDSSRKGSFGDLLLNLPRIVSVPQFFLDIPEDFDK